MNLFACFFSLSLPIYISLFVSASVPSRQRDETYSSASALPGTHNKEVTDHRVPLIRFLPLFFTTGTTGDAHSEYLIGSKILSFIIISNSLTTFSLNSSGTGSSSTKFWNSIFHNRDINRFSNIFTWTFRENFGILL